MLGRLHQFVLTDDVPRSVPTTAPDFAPVLEVSKSSVNTDADLGLWDGEPPPVTALEAVGPPERRRRQA